ncbi:MAG TPA: sugar isomerase [Planctomycetaceae bacterium]|nr:sugar isomerase [Planctomycetaceae bacterium]
MLAASEPEAPSAPLRRPLVVKPIFVYNTCNRRHQRSWRSWGGIETQAQADEEQVRIACELDVLRNQADFPVQFLPLAAVQRPEEVASLDDANQVDAILVYAAGGGVACFDAAAKFGKNMIFFVRHRSGPLYTWYEIISPRYLRRHTDHSAHDHIDTNDVVVDSQDEILWRLRALCGLRNTVKSRIVAIGGPAGWGNPSEVIAALAKERWNLDIRTVTYDNLRKLLEEALKDQAAVSRAKTRAADYLKLPKTTLETELPFVENAFVLDELFRGLMAEADCRAITINRCMDVIMPISKTTACLTLSTLNDAGYLAFCESDFVVVPAGILLANISGKPVFLNDPTYPHDGVITLAHCTAPRCMDGKNLEPARVLTHFESDYGAAPKVDMKIGQTVTNVIPDFAAKRWVGFRGRIAENPFLPICRSQIEVTFEANNETLAQHMPGFHWITAYGDHLREMGYALKKVPITWECLG